MLVLPRGNATTHFVKPNGRILAIIGAANKIWSIQINLKMQDGIKTNIKDCDGRGKMAQILNDKQADKAHYYSLNSFALKQSELWARKVIWSME